MLTGLTTGHARITGAANILLQALGLHLRLFKLLLKLGYSQVLYVERRSAHAKFVS